MVRHAEFQNINNRFTKQYGEQRGNQFYSRWLEKKSYDDTKPFPKGKEKKEKQCVVRGFEIKELGDSFHIEGLIATSHIDQLDQAEGIDIPDVIPKETLDSFANQINTIQRARVMGVHHSEGRPFDAEYFGEADIESTPASVIPLMDGEYGLFVDTKLLKDDPGTPKIISDFQNGTLNSFSITYDTDGFNTTDFAWFDDKMVRRIDPETALWGYTAASKPVNREAIATGFGFKEFKELMMRKQPDMEAVHMTKEEDAKKLELKEQEAADAKAKEDADAKSKAGTEGSPEDAEKKEFKSWKKNKQVLETKELVDGAVAKAMEGVMSNMEVKEKVLKGENVQGQGKEISLEIKEFREVMADPSTLEIKEQFRRASTYSEHLGLDFRQAVTPSVHDREYKAFRTNGRMLEYKGLGLTTNQETDTDYLQSTAELQDVYDPFIYNALNQETVTWNIFAKDDMSKKGNNKVQFVLKTAANASAAFYTGNAVATDNVSRLKNETAFKKIQVGVCVDGDMIAAARGGPVQDIFAQEVLDSTMDMLEVVNAALFAEVGLETASAVIGLEYLADSAGNTSLYNKTRSTANKLAPAAAGNTYIDGASVVISMFKLRSLKRNATTEGAKKRNLVYITNPLQGDILRSKFDDSRRMLTTKDTGFGFSTDLFVDGIPVFEDIDCNNNDWFCVDLESHRVGIWVPPTIERLGKNSDAEAAFIKMYFATYNTRPRAIGMVYDAATSI